MKCQKCASERVASVSGKTSDMCSVVIVGNEKCGYVPKDMGIGGGDYIEFIVLIVDKYRRLFHYLFANWKNQTK